MPKASAGSLLSQLGLFAAVMFVFDNGQTDEQVKHIPLRGAVHQTLNTPPRYVAEPEGPTFTCLSWQNENQVTAWTFQT